jgi:dipeptidyl aminopeptidase/acylaminoacyl peptidase
MGYGAFGLITQTSRFKATVAGAGWVDQATIRLVSRPERRYTEQAFDDTFLSNAPDGLPFWRTGDQFRRNSPLNYVDRVRTPLLIFSGDMDPVPMTEAEMSFRALVMQRKPAQFLRYWGEGHGIHIPANRRDMWQRMLAWYDNHGDVSRDENGNLLFDGDRVRSRKGTPALKPEDFAKFDLFQSSTTSERRVQKP